MAAALLSGCFPTVMQPSTNPGDYDITTLSGGDIYDDAETEQLVDIPAPPGQVPGETDPGKVIAVIKKGQRAPFSGLLFSPQATAETVAEIKWADANCEAECTRKRERQRVLAELELAKLQASYDSLSSSCTVRVKTRDDTIDFMEKKLEKVSEPDTLAWFAGGAAGGMFLGIALSIGVMAATNEIRE